MFPPEPGTTLHEIFAPGVEVLPSKVTWVMEHSKFLSIPALAFTSAKFPKINGPAKSFISDVKEAEERVFTQSDPNKLKQGPLIGSISNPKAEKLIATSTLTSACMLSS